MPFFPFGCGEFAAMVLRKEFGVKVDAPKSSMDLRKDPEIIQDYISKTLTETINPQDGDVVLMNGDRIACHVGLFVNINNQDFIFHSERRFRSACLHKVSDLVKYGYFINGFFTWRK